MRSEGDGCLGGGGESNRTDSNSQSVSECVWCCGCLGGE